MNVYDNLIYSALNGSGGGGGGGAVKMGVLRPDAELVQRWSYDKMAVADEGITLPAYSTSQVTLIASDTLGTYTIDPDSYSYFVNQRTLVIPEYSIETIAKGRMDHQAASSVFEFIFHPQGEVRTIDGSFGTKVSESNSTTKNRLVYWISAANISAYNNTVYGLYLSPNVPIVSSNSSIQIKSPSFLAKGNTSYLNETFMNALTEARLQYVIEFWRCPREDGAVCGWEQGSQLKSIYDDIANGGTLR